MAVVIESPLPTQALPPPMPMISFEDQHSGLEDSQKRSKQVLATLQWVTDRISEQQSAFIKLEYDFRAFRKEADSSFFKQEQKESLLEHRFELLEGALRKNNQASANFNQMSFNLRPVSQPADSTQDPGDLSTTEKPTDVPADSTDGSLPPGQQSGNLAQSLSLGQSMGRSSVIDMESSLVQQSVTDVEAEVRSLSFMMKKMENHLKHTEQSQMQRDQAQDELQRMEFAKMNREIEVCIKDKELESFRSIIMAKMGHVEAEAKEDAERAAKVLKENLSEKITEVQSSIERIAESTKEQVKLLDEKIQANDLHDQENDRANARTSSESRAKIAALSSQVSYLADHVGADTDVMLQSSGPGAAEEFTGGGLGGTADPDTPKRILGQSGGRPGTSNGGNTNALALRVDELQRRLDCLDGAGGLQLGNALASDATQTSPAASPPGSRASSRGQPLPARVNRLEDKHEDLVDTLEEALGIKLASDPDLEEQALSTRPGSQDGQLSGRRRNVDIGPDRLSQLEAQVNQLAATVGVELQSAASERELVVPPPSSGGLGAPAAERLGLLDAKMDEIASALGLTPDELANFARDGNRGKLAGRVVLRDEAAAVSPRMAGMIAGQEDRIGQMDTRMNDVLRDLDDKFLNKFDVHDLRLRKLEESEPRSPNPRKGANLDELEKRMNSLQNEDLSDTGATGGVPKATAKPAVEAKPPRTMPNAGAAEGGTGASGGLSAPSKENEEMLTGLQEEVRSLVDGANDIKARLRQLDTALDALRAGTPAPVVQAALAASPRGDGGFAAASSSSKAASAAAKVSEASAKAAASSADECQRLKEELAEIVNAVNIPSAELQDALFDEEKLVDGEVLDLDDEVRDDAARQYVERQTVMESRLNQLEEQLETASVVMPESQIFTSLKGVIKDVRRCLSRCELLYQLPEIKMFVKRFQRSLEVNAILHDKWLGPREQGSRPQTQEADRPLSAGRSQQCEDQLNRDSDMSRSAPDLRLSRSRAGTPGQKTRKELEGVKKKPFRTVVDWIRPHTPLKVDPVYKGGPGQNQRTGGGSGRGEERTPPYLPQIK